MITSLEAIGLKGITLVAGFFGAVVSLRFIDGLNAWSRITTVLAGTVAAAYCTPLAVEYLTLSPKLEGAVAFLAGLFGMSVVGSIIKALPEWIAAARQKWLGK